MLASVSARNAAPLYVGTQTLTVGCCTPKRYALGEQIARQALAVILSREAAGGHPEERSDEDRCSHGQEQDPPLPFACDSGLALRMTLRHDLPRLNDLHQRRDRRLELLIAGPCSTTSYLFITLMSGSVC